LNPTLLIEGLADTGHALAQQREPENRISLQLPNSKLWSPLQ
jgi:hypothetical protein